MFKNRDRYPSEKIVNKLIEDDLVLGFGDDTFPGLWFGINKKHNFSVLTAWGPRQKHGESDMEDNFHILEQTIRESGSAKEASEKFHELAHMNLKNSYNLIFADSEGAISLEWTPQKHVVREFTGMAVKTNDFSMLEEFNEGDPNAGRSAARRKNLEYIFPNHSSPQEMESLLAYHSDEDELANVCRHDYAQTIASVFAYVSRDEVKLFYSLNRTPEEHNYEKKIINLHKSE